MSLGSNVWTLFPSAFACKCVCVCLCIMKLPTVCWTNLFCFLYYFLTLLWTWIHAMVMAQAIFWNLLLKWHLILHATDKKLVDRRSTVRTWADNSRGGGHPWVTQLCNLSILIENFLRTFLFFFFFPLCLEMKELHTLSGGRKREQREKNERDSQVFVFKMKSQ